MTFIAHFTSFHRSFDETGMDKSIKPLVQKINLLQNSTYIVNSCFSILSYIILFVHRIIYSGLFIYYNILDYNLSETKM